MTEQHKKDSPKKSQKNQLTGKKIGFVLLSSFILISWLKQESLREYWEQSYQSTKAWDFVATYFPNLLKKDETGEKKPVFDKIAHFNKDVNGYANQLIGDNMTPQPKQQPVAVNQPVASTPTVTVAPTQKTASTHIHIGANDKVFFVGDSLMQGVAPWVMRSLQNDYQIKSLDLSKQSTGLSYSKFFDWPANIEKTLQENPEINAMVVLLGPNDPWDIPDPDNKAKVVKFASPRWQEVYTSRMQRILTATQKHNVQVLWITPPVMKKTALDKGMLELGRIMHEGIRPEQAIVIDSNKVLAKDNQYADSIQLDGKIVKVRTADGIHFTPEGQKLVAKQVLSYFKIQ